MTREELISITAAADLADQAARADYNKFTTTGKKSPMLKAVRDFQSIEGQLTNDGKWGPNSSVAARYYLNRAVTPALYSPNAKITWHPPTEESEAKLAQQQHVKTTPKAKEVVTRKKTPPPEKPRYKQSAAQEKANREAPDVKQQLFKAAKLDMPEHGQDQVLQTNNHDAEQRLADNLNKKREKDLAAALAKLNKENAKKFKEIQALLKKQAISKQATHEHKKIVKKDSFEKDVKGGLASIVKLLKTMPDRHPQKQKVAAIGRRFLGLLLT